MLILSIVGSAIFLLEMIIGIFQVNWLRPLSIGGTPEENTFLQNISSLYGMGLIVAGALLSFSIVGLALSKNE
jgi:hypothetical protein